MIYWSINPWPPRPEALEQFLFAFRDKKLSELILNDCDVAFFPLDAEGSGWINYLIPRSSGCLNVFNEIWHLAVAPFYPYTDILITDTGYTGATEVADGLARMRVGKSGVEVIDVWSGLYQEFLENAQARGLVAWYVYQEDSTLRLKFRSPGPGVKHTKLSAEQTIHPSEYLMKNG